MKQALFITLSVFAFVAILTTCIVREIEEQKEIAVMRNDIYHMSSQVEKYDELLGDFTDMACEIYEDFDVSVNRFYKQTDVDSMRIYYNDVCNCYKVVEKYATDNIEVELKFSDVLQKNRQTDR